MRIDGRDQCLIRHPAAMVASSGQLCIVSARDDQPPLVFRGPLAGSIRALLKLAVTPVKTSAALELLGGVDAGIEALRVLGRAGVLVRTEPGANVAAARDDETQGRICGRVVVGICGGVEAATLHPYLDRLYFEVAERIDITLTRAARRFVRPKTLRRLYQANVWTKVFDASNQSGVLHLDLASADLILVIPATAAALQRFASGACSDLISLVVAATSAPVVIIPAMHISMWKSAAVQRNVERVQRDGFIVVEPGPGIEIHSGSEARVQIGGPGVTPRGLVRLCDAVLAKPQSSLKTSGEVASPGLQTAGAT